MKKGLSYDDVLIEPKKSCVRSRKNVSTSINLCEGIKLDSPIISANMDTITGKTMIEAMDEAGGMGIHHRYVDSEEQAENIRQLNSTVGASVGIDEDYIENSIKFEEAGADVICVDIAHGHMEACIEAVSLISESVDIPIIAGNIATKQGAIDLVDAGADVIKVGIGPGSTCTTRQKTGVGVPQFTAVKRVSGVVGDEIGVIADGGIRKAGDMSKALLAGADAVMCGGIFGGCEETPGRIIETDEGKYKEVRGMASKEARKSREDIEIDEQRSVEGKRCYKEVTGSVQDKVKEMVKGLRSTMSYVGAHNIEEARNNAEFIQVTNTTINRNGVHSHDVID